MNITPLTVWTDVQTFFPMIWAVLRGKYKMPWGTFFWGLLCLAYILSPIDVLPDVLPVLGITDDGAFIVLVLSMLHKDLVSFRRQREKDACVIEAEIVAPTRAGGEQHEKNN